MVVGPKTDKYPVILHYDDSGNPKRIAETNIITVDGITASSINTLTISATSYLGAPIGGVTAIGQLADVDPQIADAPGNLLIVGAGNAVSGMASSTFATTATTDSLDSRVTVLEGGSPGSYLPLAGGTLTGDLIVNTDLFASTVSASTYNNLPQALTGGDTGVITLPGGSTTYLNGDGGWTSPTGAGATTFIALTDTFAAYAGRTGQLLYVDSASTVNSMASTVFAEDTDLANYVPKTGTTTVTGSVYATVGLSAPTVNATTYTNLPVAAAGVQGVVTPDNDNTHFLDGEGSWKVPPGAPGGSTTQIQFNSGGVFGGDSNLIWNNTLKRLSVSSISATTYVNVPTASLATSSASGLIPAFTSNNQRNYFAGNGSWTYFSGVSGTSASEGFLKLANDNQSLAGAALRSTDSRLTLPLSIEKGLSIIDPVENDEITIFICPTGRTYTIDGCYTILAGTTPTVSATYYVASDRTDVAATAFMSFQSSSTTLMESAVDVYGEVNQAITGGDMVWILLNSVGGTATEYHATLTLTRTG